MNILQKIENNALSIGVIGLGYVGLPLAVAFARVCRVNGYDINFRRVEELCSGTDRTGEVTAAEIRANNHLRFSNDPSVLIGADLFVVTVPTPVDEYKVPDLSPLRQACETVGTMLHNGAVVVFESTVYPGCTEEFCVPLLEDASGLKLNEGFFVAFSPERINQGDPLHRFENVKKVVSGSTPDIARALAELYGKVVSAGIHVAPSIKIAEAAKVIENTQRDINVAFVNELAMLFDTLGIDTLDVLEAAGTKWNFLNFRPGLVGGHCIGVDPYYLAHKARQVGFHPALVLAGRRVNDGMAKFVAAKLLRAMAAANKNIVGATVAVLGATFKENCKDIRNSLVFEILTELRSVGCKPVLVDPWADADEVAAATGYSLFAGDICQLLRHADAVMLAVAHRQFAALDFSECVAAGTVLFDLKGSIDRRLQPVRL